MESGTHLSCCGIRLRRQVTPQMVGGRWRCGKVSWRDPCCSGEKYRGIKGQVCWADHGISSLKNFSGNFCGGRQPKTVNWRGKARYLCTQSSSRGRGYTIRWGERTTNASSMTCQGNANNTRFVENMVIRVLWGRVYFYCCCVLRPHFIRLLPSSFESATGSEWFVAPKTE